MYSATATLRELCEITGAELRGGSPEKMISGVSSLSEAGPEDIAWLSNQKFAADLRDCRAGAVIMRPAQPEVAMAALVTPDPELAVALVLGRFRRPIEQPALGVHETAVIAPTAKLGAHVRIGAFAWVGAEARIGDGCILHPHAHVSADCWIGAGCELFPGAYVGDACILGDRVVVQPGGVIGSDGFGFIYRNGAHRRIPHTGIVILKDDVEVGANSCVDRAKVGATLVGRGTKIDNQVQIAHNCKIGSDCILAGQTGISGSVRMGNGVIMGGRAGSTDGVEICDGARIGLVSVVTKDITAPGDYAGMPARPHIEHNRAMGAMRQAGKSATLIRQMERRIAELERKLEKYVTGGSARCD